MKQLFLSLGLLFLLVQSSFGQNSCSSAPTLSCNVTYQSSTANASNSYGINDYNCHASNNSFNGRDGYFRVNVTSGSTLTIDMTNLTADLDLFVFRNCSGSRPSLCIDKSTRSGTSSEQVVITGASGTYYIMVDGYNSSQFGSFNIRASCQTGGGCTDCGGDGYTCSDAERIFCGNSYSHNNFNSGNQSEFANLDGCDSGINPNSNPFTANDRYYRIDVPSSSNSLEINLTGMSADLDMFLYRSCFDGGEFSNELSCSDRSVNTGNTNEQIILENASGTYYLLIDGYNTSQRTNYTLRVDCGNGGFDCDDAERVFCGNAYNRTTIGGTNNFTYSDLGECASEIGANGNPFDGNDRLFRIDVPAGQSNLTIDMTGLSRDLDMFLFDHCSDGGSNNPNIVISPLSNCLASSHNSGSNSEKIVLSNAFGTYYLLVDGFNSSQFSNFTIRLTCDDGGFNCNDAERIFCGNTYNRTTIGGSNSTEFDNIRPCDSGINASTNPFTGNDKLFRIDVPSSSRLVINMSGLSRDLDMFLYDNCQSSSGEFSNSFFIGCSGRGINTGTQNEQIILDNAVGTYYLLVDGPQSSFNSNFTLRVDCENCNDQVDNNCDAISYNYTGANGSLRYNFNVPFSTSANGTWSARQTNSSSTLEFGSGRNVSYNFSNSGTYIICYTYTNTEGCQVQCCKTIRIDNPYDCNLINYQFNGTNYVLNIPGITNATWIDDDTNQQIGTGTSVNIPTTDGCRTRNFSVYFFDPAINAYRICCIRIYICDPYNCDLINYQFNGTNYVLNIPGISNATWYDDDTNAQIGTGTSVNVPTTGGCRTRNFSVRFFDPGTNSYRICCIRIYICDPYDCDLINYQFNGTNYVLNIPGISNATWIDDDTNAQIGTGTSVNVPTTGGCRTRNFSVRFFDPGTNSYRICCIRIYICDPYDCDLINYQFNGTNYVLNIPGITNATWIDDDTNQQIGTGTSVNVPVTGGCRTRNFSVRFFDPAINGYRICCIRIFICDPYDCDLINYQFNGTNYVLNIPGISNATWYDDDTNAQIGTGTSVNVTPDGSCRVRNFSVRFFDPAINGYRICCIRIYICDPYDCDLINYQFNGTNYVLNIPGITNATWIDDDTNAQIGTGTSVNVPISGGCRTRNFSVRFFDPAINGYRICCIRIYICDPYDCNSIQQNVNTSNNTVLLNLPDINNNQVLFWQDDDTNQQIAGGTTTISIQRPSPGQCRNISVYFFDPAVGSYRICCIRVCNGDDPCFGTPSGQTCENTFYAPVCGCDNVTYYNDCIANKNGIYNFNTGRCPTPSTCIVPSAGNPDFICTSIYDPVCGCDGNTYSNECVAAAAGLQSWTIGACHTGCQNEIDLVTNGNFSGGNFGFTSDLMNMCACDNGSYCVSTNSISKCSTLSPMTYQGNYLIIQTIPNGGDRKVWGQNVTVSAGEEYEFSVDYNYLLTTASSFSLQLRINGTPVGDIFGLFNQQANWQTYSTTWTPNFSGTATIEIYDLYSIRPATAYGLDNIQLTYCPGGSSTAQCCDIDQIITQSWYRSAIASACEGNCREVWCVTYNGQSAIEVRTDQCITDGTTEVYDCNGNLLERYGGFGGIEPNGTIVEISPIRPYGACSGAVGCCSDTDILNKPLVRAILAETCAIASWCGDKELICATYNGQPALYLTNCGNIPDLPSIIYDCNGKEITRHGYWTGELVGDLILGSTIWTSQQCTNQGAVNLSSGNTIPTSALSIFPNPFTDQTTITFLLETDAPATISIFNVNGQKVFEQTGDFAQGINTVNFDAPQALPAGIYYTRLQTADEVRSKSMMLSRR